MINLLQIDLIPCISWVESKLKRLTGFALLKPQNADEVLNVNYCERITIISCITYQVTQSEEDFRFFHQAAISGLMKVIA